MTTRGLSSDDRLTRLVRDVQIVVQESSNLLSSLYVEKPEHQHFVLPYDRSTAKRYFLSRCLMDVQTAVGAQLRLIDYVRREVEGRADGDSEGVRAITSASIIAEQSLWRRRLAEVLARLVLFSTTNTDDHYLHYLLLSDAEENGREVKNLERDFRVASATLARRSNDLRAQLVALPVARPVWYEQERRRGQFGLAPATEIIRSAIALAVPREKTALCHSYLHSFSGPSQVIHFSTTARRDRDEQGLIDFGTATLLLLSTSITTRVGALAGLPTSARLDPDAPLNVPELPAVGDYVVVTLDRGSVYIGETLSVEATTAIVGRVRVRFIGGSPYADIPEDDFPSDLVHVFLRGEDLRTSVRSSLPDGFVPSEDELRDSYSYAVERAWTLGMRDMWIRGLRAAGAQPDTT